MIFANISLFNGISIKAKLDEVDFTAVCPVCGKEFPIDTPALMDAWSEDGEALCDECGEMLKRFTSYRPGESFGRQNWLAMLTKTDYPSHIFTYALHHAPREALDSASDQFMSMVPGYHDDKPLGEINEEIERRARGVIGEAGQDA